MDQPAVENIKADDVPEAPMPEAPVIKEVEAPAAK
jgi:hypothetical protein